MQINRQAFISQPAGNGNMQIEKVLIKDLIASQDKIMLNKISGLILCGGNSSRMQEDKAFLKYHSIAQYKYLASLFENIGIPVLISCNASNKKNVAENYFTCTDDEAFKDNGPISGLLTAFTHQPESSFLLVGCDYPHLKQTHIEELISLSKFGFDAVCFVKNKDATLHEPLLTYYDNSCKIKLNEFILSGNSSLKHFLNEVHTLKVLAEEDQFLKSFDTPEDFKTYHT